MKRRLSLYFLLILLPLLLISSSVYCGWYYAGGTSETPEDVTVTPATASGVWNNYTAYGGTKAECVLSEDAIYIYRSDSVGGQGFTDKPSLPTGTILGVQVHIIAKSDTGDTTYVNPSLRVNGTNYGSGGQLITESYVDYYYEWTANPDTSSQWVKEDVEGTGSNPLSTWYVYGDGISSGETQFVDKMWLVVRYN